MQRMEGPSLCLRKSAGFCAWRRARPRKVAYPPPGENNRRQESEGQGSEDCERYQGIVPAELSVAGRPGPKPEGTRGGQREKVPSRQDAESGKRLGDPEEERGRHHVAQRGEHEHDARRPDGVVVDWHTLPWEFRKPDRGNAETHERENRRKRRRDGRQEETRPVAGTHVHPRNTIHLESSHFGPTLWFVGRSRTTSPGFSTQGNTRSDTVGVGDAGATSRSGSAPPRRRVSTGPPPGRVPAARSPAPYHYVGSGDRAAGTWERLRVEAAGRGS